MSTIKTIIIRRFFATWANITGKPATFPPEAHTHTLAGVTDAGDSAGLDVGTTAGTVAAGDHTHTLAGVTDAGTAAAQNVEAFTAAAHGKTTRNLLLTGY